MLDVRTLSLFADVKSAVPSEMELFPQINFCFKDMKQHLRLINPDAMITIEVSFSQAGPTAM